MRTRELLHLESELILCACGCGEMIHSISKKGEPARYKSKHFAKVLQTLGTNSRFKSGYVTEWTFVKGEIKPWQTVAEKGTKAPNWKGGRLFTGDYIIIYQPDHHFVSRKGYVMEHRLVWEQHNKASLLPWTIIHHINGIKTDNRPENLEAMSPADHCSLHKPSRFKVSTSYGFDISGTIK